MANKCPNCNFKITSRNQLCDDYRDPNKAYGCPGCGTFYILPKNQPKPWYYWVLVLGNALMIGVIWNIVQVKGATVWLFWGYMTALALVLLVKKLLATKKELQDSGYRSAAAND